MGSDVSVVEPLTELLGVGLGFRVGRDIVIAKFGLHSLELVAS